MVVWFWCKIVKIIECFKIVNVVKWFKFIESAYIVGSRGASQLGGIF